MIHLPWLWEVRVNSGDRLKQRNELINILTNRKVNDDQQKAEAAEDKDLEANGTAMWHVGTARSHREYARGKQRSKNHTKSFFWSDLLNELNEKAAPPVSSSSDSTSMVKRSPKVDKIASISAEVLLDGYSVSECPFGHRRLVGSHAISKDSINCRHCRYLIALHEQRNRGQPRRLVQGQNQSQASSLSQSQSQGSDTSRSMKALNSNTVLPDIRERVSPECNDSSPLNSTTVIKGANIQPPATDREQPQSTSTSNGTSAATKARTTRRKLGSIHKEQQPQQQPSIPSPQHAVSNHVSHLYVAGTMSEINRQEEKVSTTTVAPVAQVKSVRTATSRQVDQQPQPVKASGSSTATIRAERAALISDAEPEIRIAKKEPPFYTLFANPFDTAGLAIVLKDRILEMQRLECATVRREREEEARRRMKRARKQRAATTTDDAEDDDA